MKPTLPEDRELEQLGSEVSGRYRAVADDEPPPRLDAAIREAARLEAQPQMQPQRPRRNWQVPASIAAVLVIGVSLVLIVRDNEAPLPTLEEPAAEEAKLARSAPPQLALKAQPKAKADTYREARPSRERSARPDREPAARDEMADTGKNAARKNMAGENAATGNVAQRNAAREDYAASEKAASGMVAPPVAAPDAQSPAAPATAAAPPAKSAEQERAGVAQSGENLPATKTEAAARADAQSRASVQALRKQEGAGDAARPQDWLAKIDGLLREGKEGEARDQLLEFRKQFPHYPLVERLQALLPPDQR